MASLRPSRKLAWFLAGDLFLAVVVCSPLDQLARHYLLTAEIIEQMLIAMVATYALVLGTPERVVRRLRLDRLSLPYYFAWITGMAVLTISHSGRVLNPTQTSETVRYAEFAILLASGAVFWWPLHSPLREQRIPLMPNSLFYLAAAVVWCSFLGLVLAFEQPGEYYVKSLDPLRIAESLTRDWSFTPENDQETAGLLFWIGAIAILLTEVMLVYYRWYTSPEDQKTCPYAPDR